MNTSPSPSTLCSVKITRRFDPCGCGCQGDDPWHARSFVRTLTSVREESGSRVVHAYSEPVRYGRIAEAQLPWGEGKRVIVVEVLLGTTPIGWFSTRDLVDGSPTAGTG